MYAGPSVLINAGLRVRFENQAKAGPPCGIRPPGVTHAGRSFQVAEPTPSPCMRLVLATRNPGKVDELRALLAGLPIELVSAAEIEGAPQVEEDAPSLQGNARKKALALHEATGLPALADDTGLEVDALNGRPGVHSARYAGEAEDAEANRARLLREMQTVPKRDARFRTVLAFAVGGSVRLFEGVCEGVITMQERGSKGFGYDSIFQPAGGIVTFAEMPTEQKNAISHRRRALDQFVAYLQLHLG